MASSSTREEAPSSTIVGEAPPPVTMEAKMIVATGHGHCQQLKDMLLSKEDASIMAVVMASSNQASKPPNPPSPAMDYRLLAAACSGSFLDLESLLTGEDCRQASCNGTIRSSALPRASDDEEAFLRESLLDGVTSNGDTLLHVVATNGDSEDFLNKAGLIHRKALNLLFVQNNEGDTPLHCAARAANSQMVFLLVDLAKGQDNNDNRSVKALLEKENKIKETALHEAIRGGNNDIVKMLMEEHPRLARLPKDDGTSPLYLAILLENKTIAKTLYQMSDKILSYSGPNGQNALHAAVFGVGGKDLTEMLLEWNKDLTIQQDEKGNTPLHSAASSTGLIGHLLLLLQANPNAIHQEDHNGSFPIHVAASVGATQAITDFLEKSPNCAGLR
ncbi:death-associated protein kinase dapk-1 isoform X1 [Brachypodium distachyon]|uniref:Uncharacterized protein n=1 Tax=Brachypodium distachyon TaxID=15368 RepID=I1IFM3_BRADI|nr:death-associated protein kinase dapk-1 isoform X1 [Brachypodium distachyon]KQK02085.1 hypothetical protein BRADI_3g60280v3 [Brachypodium distachyon]PNT69703.1 hypothetical protein BRADI_3g60280v3 [Brachypodium distachyon]|eukprot:XP_010236919.2 death-associated protein kinase dapk-1 isoform X1 [Brachypodium distachyon]